jgi:asparagine synthase (glutamine-hydrolysing)
MCGIVGFVETDGSVDPGRLEVMNGSMASRGPDGEGYYYSGCGRLGMGMRRLAIVDLSGGGQPLYSEDRQVVAMQNGEIYNHRDLRRQLEAHGHRFATGSDTEVLAHGYEQWGLEGLLARVDGMYAVAIYDRRRQQLHLARDRFGEKPLYYHAAPGRFVYGSQLLTVASYPGVDRGWDPEGLYWYLALHFVPGDGTVWRGVRKLRPGHHATVALATGACRIARYWRLDEQQDRPCRPEEILEALDHAVQSRLMADVPVGLFLSGGLDSSVVAALAVRHAPRVATFSMGFSSEAHDERPYAQQVARALGTTHQHFEFDGQSFQKLLPRVVAAMDEPVGDQAMLPLFWLCAEASRSVKVVLSGEGADELFAGYSYYPGAVSRRPRIGWWARLRRWLRGRAPDARLLLETNCTPSGFPLLTSEAERLALLGRKTAPGFGRWYPELLRHWENTADPLRRACLVDVETWLAEDLLMKFDKMAMASSLEGRAPYLSPRLAQAAFRLPQAQKLTPDQNKKLLRAVADRLLPEAISRRPKQGFVLPMSQWLAGHFQEEAGARLFREVDMGLDREFAAHIVSEDLQRGVGRERLLYALLVLGSWAMQASAQARQLQTAMAATPAGQAA